MTFTPPPFPSSRPRRLRRDAFTRALVGEHRLAPEDLILPVFVLEGQGREEAVASMPGVSRRSLDGLYALAYGLVAGYACAWVGHFVFEKNKPASFKRPLYSFVGDSVM